MNKEIRSIISSLEGSLSGQPWYGRSVYEILEEVEPTNVYEKPGGNGHSLAELLYHMLAWAAFTLSSVRGDKEEDVLYFEKLDWRTIDPSEHTWEKGLTQLKKVHQDLVALLKTKDDTMLEQIATGRKYNYHYLLTGLVQHNIYHQAQIAYVNKLIVNRQS